MSGKRAPGPARRRGPVGPGHMPKGGAQAARVHNDSLPSSVAVAEPDPVGVEPVSDAVRLAGGGVRASARARWSDALWLARFGSGLAALDLVLNWLN